MKELQTDVLYLEDVLVWESIRLLMKKIQNEKCTDLNLMDQYDPDSTNKQSKRLSRINDEDYENSDLEQEVSKLNHFTKFQQVILLGCLKHYEDIFGGNLVEWTGPLVDTPIKDAAKTYHE